jgi:hypothetical protein
MSGNLILTDIRAPDVALHIRLTVFGTLIYRSESKSGEHGENRRHGVA